MSRGVNKFIGIGTVGQDPELKYMPNGNAVANLSIAVNESWKDKASGQQQERVEWIKIVFFNRLAEIVGEYVKKGAKLYVEGSLRTRSWEQDGIKRYATEIVANEMQMLDSRGGDDRQAHPQDSEARTAPGSSRQNPNGTATSPYQGFDNFDDDSELPF